MMQMDLVHFAGQQLNRFGGHEVAFELVTYRDGIAVKGCYHA
jgi:hypothetical protein